MSNCVRQTMLVVSTRGRITLPAATRMRLGIGAGDRLTFEERGGVIVLSRVRGEEECYTDAQIAEWTRADRWDDQERKRILRSTRAAGRREPRGRPRGG